MSPKILILLCLMTSFSSPAAAAQSQSLKSWFQKQLPIPGKATKLSGVSDNTLSAAHNGDAEAQWKLGEAYLRAGKYKDAMDWFYKAAAQGNKPAMRDLGLMFEHGMGVPADMKQANFWYDRAGVDPDKPPAQDSAYGSASDHIPPADAKPLPAWLSDVSAERAKAMAGDPEAQWKLGRAYLDGLGVKQSLDMAKYWFHKSADQNYSNAENDLGNIATKAGNFDQAIEWFNKAIAQGNKAAMANMAEMYEKGVGVPQDPAKAKYLYDKAGIDPKHPPVAPATARTRSDPCAIHPGQERIPGPAQGCMNGHSLRTYRFEEIDNGSWKVTEQAHNTVRPEGMPSKQQDRSWCAHNTRTASELNNCLLEQEPTRVPSQAEWNEAEDAAIRNFSAGVKRANREKCGEDYCY